MAARFVHEAKSGDVLCPSISFVPLLMSTEG